MKNDFIRNELLKFDVSISDKCYDHKPTSTEYAHMTFHVENLNVEELCQEITSGYSFCHVFKNNIRQKANFLYTNLIAIDVDDYPVTMEEFVDNCRAKPSLAYTTISDGRNGLSRFRLIYVFDHPIQNEEEYKCLYCQLIGQLGLQDNKDNCGSRISQLMNGNHRADIKTFCSNQILTKHILLQKCQLEYYQSSPLQYISNRQFCKINEVAANGDESKIISDLFEGPDYFLQKHSQVSIITETPLDYNTDGYAFFPDQFFKLIIRVDWSKQKPKVNKFKDGEGRRKRIFIDALIIRNIKPDATFLELLYNLVLRRKLYYDNSDGVLTNQLLIDDVRQVQQMDLEEVHALKPSRHGQFQTDPNYCALHGITRRKHSRTVRKWLNFISIGEWYDVNTSVNENFRYAKDNGIKVSLNTLKKFCVENNIEQHPEIKPVNEWYDVRLSVRKNLEWAKVHGIKVSQTSLYNYCNEYGIDPKGEK